MNRKGSAFALSMVILTWILIGFTWYCFSLANVRVETEISSVDNLTQVYDSGDRLSFYFEESAKLSANQAHCKTAQEPAAGSLCFTKSYNGENIIQLTDSCKPDIQSLNEKFLSEYNKSFYDLLEKYPEKEAVENISVFHSIENDAVTTSVRKTLAARHDAAYASYSVNYDLDKDFTNNIYLGDFANIYEKSLLALDECKDKEIETCLEQTISFENWDFNAVKAGTWVLFEFSTKKSFFLMNEEKFSPVVLRFGIAL